MDSLKEYYRPNVGMVIINAQGQVFWARRCGDSGWQLPQGGIQKNEEPIEAMFRELKEETGIERKLVRVLGKTKGWLHYRLPKKKHGQRDNSLFVGQKQKWFLVQLLGGDEVVNLTLTQVPEFDCWRWVSYWYPARHVISFKQAVYRQALMALMPKTLSAQ